MRTKIQDKIAKQKILRTTPQMFMLKIKHGNVPKIKKYLLFPNRELLY